MLGAFTLSMFLGAATPNDTGGATPLGFHRRVENGWVLLAVSAPVSEPGASVMDAPALGAAVRAGLVRALGEPREGAKPLHPAGRAAIHATGASPHQALVSALLAPPPPPATLEPIDRHLLALAGERSPAITAASRSDAVSPTIVLVDRGPPDDSMRVLSRAVSVLPPVPGRLETDAPVRAHARYWRHLASETEEPVVALGARFPEPGPRQVYVVRMLLGALERRLERRAPGVAMSVTPISSGLFVRVSWSAPPDSVPAFRRELEASLADLRDAPLSRAECEAERRRVVEVERAELRGTTRQWCESILLGAISGRLPVTSIAALDLSAELDPEVVQSIAALLIPRAIVAVSTGPRAPMPADPGPTETWLWPEPILERLPPEARIGLARAALERARRALFGDGVFPEALRVESEWQRARSDAPLTGVLDETLIFPGAIRRDMFPAGPDLVLSTWIDGDASGGSVQGVPREPEADEISRLRHRLAADPWNAVRTAHGAPDSLLVYLASADRDAGDPARWNSGVLPGVHVRGAGHGLRILFDPETGLPVRVFYRTEETSVPAGLDLDGYSEAGVPRYPGRIERFQGPRRDAVHIVRSFAPLSRLAAGERLQ